VVKLCSGIERETSLFDCSFPLSNLAEWSIFKPDLGLTDVLDAQDIERLHDLIPTVRIILNYEHIQALAMSPKSTKLFLLSPNTSSTELVRPSSMQ
jgi:hypothetical protein